MLSAIGKLITGEDQGYLLLRSVSPDDRPESVDNYFFGRDTSRDSFSLAASK